MPKFSEVLKALEGKTKGTKDKKGSTTFSKKDFADLTASFLNEDDYVAKGIKTVNGEYTEVESHPVKEFREAFIKDVLVKHGIDKQEAEAAARAYQYSPKQAETLYPVITELIYQYIGAGRTFNFHNKADFTAAIKMRDIEAHDSTFKNRETGVESVTAIAPHRVLIKKSSAPAWKKTKKK